jgi:hypothetical protein
MQNPNRREVSGHTAAKKGKKMVAAAKKRPNNTI